MAIIGTIQIAGDRGYRFVQMGAKKMIRALDHIDINNHAFLFGNFFYQRLYPLGWNLLVLAALNDKAAGWARRQKGKIMRGCWG